MEQAKQLQQKVRGRLQELKPKQMVILDMMENLQRFVDHTEEAGSLLKPEAMPGGNEWDTYRDQYDRVLKYLFSLSRIPKASNPRSAEWLICELDERLSFFPVGEEPHQLYSCYHFLEYVTRLGRIPCRDDVEHLNGLIQESAGILSGDMIEGLSVALALMEAEQALR